MSHKKDAMLIWVNTLLMLCVQAGLFLFTSSSDFTMKTSQNSLHICANLIPYTFISNSSKCLRYSLKASSDLKINFRAIICMYKTGLKVSDYHFLSQPENGWSTCNICIYQSFPLTAHLKGIATEDDGWFAQLFLYYD